MRCGRGLHHPLILRLGRNGRDDMGRPAVRDGQLWRRNIWGVRTRGGRRRPVVLWRATNEREGAVLVLSTLVNAVNRVALHSLCE